MTELTREERQKIKDELNELLLQVESKINLLYGNKEERNCVLVHCGEDVSDISYLSKVHPVTVSGMLSNMQYVMLKSIFIDEENNDVTQH